MTGFKYTILWYVICILHCVPTSQSNLLSPYAWPPSPFTTPIPFPLVPVSMSFFVYFSCLLICYFRFFTPLWVKSYDSLLFLSYLFHLAWNSQDPSMLSQLEVFHFFLRLSSIAQNTLNSSQGRQPESPIQRYLSLTDKALWMISSILYIRSECGSFGSGAHEFKI